MSLLPQFLPYTNDFLSGLARGLGTYIVPVVASVAAGLYARRASLLAKAADNRSQSILEEIGTKIDAVLAFKYFVNSTSKLLIIPRKRIEPKHIATAKNGFYQMKSNEKIMLCAMSPVYSETWEKFEYLFLDLCEKSEIRKQTNDDLRDRRKAFAESTIAVFRLLKDDVSSRDEGLIRDVLTTQDTTSVFSATPSTSVAA